MPASAKTPAQDPAKRFGGWLHPQNLKEDFKAIAEANRISLQISLPKFLEKKGFSKERAAGVANGAGALLSAFYLAGTAAMLFTAAAFSLQFAPAVIGFSPVLAAVLGGGLAAGMGLLTGIFVSSAVGAGLELGKSAVQGATNGFNRLTGRKPAPQQTSRAAPAPAPEAAPETSPAPEAAPAATPEPARPLDAGASTGEAFKAAAETAKPAPEVAKPETPSPIESKPVTPPPAV